VGRGTTHSPCEGEVLLKRGIFSRKPEKIDNGKFDYGSCSPYPRRKRSTFAVNGSGKTCGASASKHGANSTWRSGVAACGMAHWQLGPAGRGRAPREGAAAECSYDHVACVDYCPDA
jgi:hypothetical protein